MLWFPTLLIEQNILSEDMSSFLFSMLLTCRDFSSSNVPYKPLVWVIYADPFISNITADVYLFSEPFKWNQAMGGGGKETQECRGQ